MRDDEQRRKFQGRIGRDGTAVLNGLGLQVLCKWCIVDPTDQGHERRIGIWSADDDGRYQGYRLAWAAHCELPRHRELVAIRARELSPWDAERVYRGKAPAAMDGWVRYGDEIERVMFGSPGLSRRGAKLSVGVQGRP